MQIPMTAQGSSSCTFYYNQWQFYFQRKCAASKANSDEQIKKKQKTGGPKANQARRQKQKSMIAV